MNSSFPPNQEDAASRGGEPTDSVAPLPADNGSIPKISPEEAWGTNLIPVTETPTPFRGLRDGQ